MTQAEKIAEILKVLEQLENALFANDRTAQIDYARKASEIRKKIS